MEQFSNSIKNGEYKTNGEGRHRAIFTTAISLKRPNNKK